jgi:hypothetical protein
MPGLPRVPAPLPPKPTTIPQWCPTCEACTPSLIIQNREYCAVCEPDGPGADDDDYDDDYDDG